MNLLLEAGAKTDCKNSVNRSAAEMAAFVGKVHQLTSVIDLNYDYL